ncbi:glycosyltransferase family 4 protein [Arthrobacter sp. UYCu723]
MEGVAWDLATGLAPMAEVHVLTTTVPGHGAQFVADGVHVKTISGTKPGRYSPAWWVKTALWSQASHYNAVLSVSAGASSMARFNRSPRYVFQAHGTAFSELLALLAGKPRLWPLKALRLAYWDLVDRSTYKLVDAVVPVSDIVGGKLKQSRYSRTWDKTEFAVIANGVVTPPNLLPDSAARSRFGLSAEDAVVVTVSRLVRQKGVDRVIEAIVTSTPDTKLLVVGDGPESRTLRAQAAAAGVADRVVFSGHLDKAGVGQALRISDAFIFPVRDAQREGLPLAVLEAIACGLPVVVPKDSTWDADLVPCLRFTDVSDPTTLSAEIAASVAAERVTLPSVYTHESMVGRYKDVLGF